MFESVAEYPHWFVVACAAVAAAAVLWLLVKLLKLALWMLFFGVLVVAGASAVWLFFR
jgi:hypothetical protein